MFFPDGRQTKTRMRADTPVSNRTLYIVGRPHQQNTFVLVGTCNLLEQLGSDPREIPRTIQVSLLLLG